MKCFWAVAVLCMLTSGESSSVLLPSCVLSPARDWAALNPCLPVSKFCVLSTVLCFTNLLNSDFMSGIVLGVKDQKTNKAELSLFDRKDSASYQFITPELSIQPSLPALWDWKWAQA